MAEILIREFQPGDEEAFRALNVEWIERYFRMEAPDHEALSHPQASILAPGGRIFLAVRDSLPVGCCALIRTGETEFEIAKMAVTTAAQGSGVGRLLLTRVIDEARRSGATHLHLETNHVLVPAIRLYESLGFAHVARDPGDPSPYARSDVNMELRLRD